MRYYVTHPGSKGKEITKLAKRVLGDKNVLDDISLIPKNYGTKLRISSQNKALKDVDIFIDPKKLVGKERNLLMEKTYRDSARILQKTNPSLNAKLAKDIEAGFGGKFDKVFSNRNFILGDRTAVTVAKTTEKLATAPKQLPKPIATGPTTAEIAKARVSAGMGIPARETLKTIPKVDRSKIIKLERAQRKIKSAARGEGTGPVIAEGLKGVGSAPKPAWWQGRIPSWLRVGEKAYEGAYPGAVSSTKIGIGAGGMLFGGSILHEGLKDSGLEVEGPPEITDEQLMAQMVEEYKNSYQPTQTQDANVILPSAIE